MGCGPRSSWRLSVITNKPCPEKMSKTSPPEPETRCISPDSDLPDASVGRLAGAQWQRDARQWVARYNDALMQLIKSRVSFNEDAEDIAQEVYMRLAQKLSNLDVDQGFHNPRAFLFRIARNFIIDAARKRNADRLDKWVSLEDEVITANAPSVERIVADQRAILKFEQAVAKLPRKCRKVYILQRVGGFTYQEIAEKCRISVSAVEKHMARAIAQVKKSMDGLNE